MNTNTTLTKEVVLPESLVAKLVRWLATGLLAAVAIAVIAPATYGFLKTVSTARYGAADVSVHGGGFVLRDAAPPHASIVEGPSMPDLGIYGHCDDGRCELNLGIDPDDPIAWAHYGDAPLPPRRIETWSRVETPDGRVLSSSRSVECLDWPENEPCPLNLR